MTAVRIQVVGWVDVLDLNQDWKLFLPNDGSVAWIQEVATGHNVSGRYLYHMPEGARMAACFFASRNGSALAGLEELQVYLGVKVENHQSWRP